MAPDGETVYFLWVGLVAFVSMFLVGVEPERRAPRVVAVMMLVEGVEAVAFAIATRAFHLAWPMGLGTTRAGRSGRFTFNSCRWRSLRLAHSHRQVLHTVE